MRVAFVAIATVLASTAAYSGPVKWVPLNSTPEPVTKPKATPPPPVIVVPAVPEIIVPDEIAPPVMPAADPKISLVEIAVKATLKDPYSAQFTWPNGFVQGWYKPPFGKKYEGLITCGLVNSKNSYGGYVGEMAVIGVISGGIVIKINMDEPNAPYHRTEVADACAKIGVPVR